MLAKDILIDGFGRVREEVHAAVEGLGPDGLGAPPGPDPNYDARDRNSGVYGKRVKVTVYLTVVA
ncbi:hypothetical protein ACWDOG_21330, partial [Streptomyces fungicidicus]